MTWKKGNITIRKHPQASDYAICEHCGKRGKVGREVFISWGLAVNGTCCKECRSGK